MKTIPSAIIVQGQGRQKQKQLDLTRTETVDLKASALRRSQEEIEPPLCFRLGVDQIDENSDDDPG